VTRRAVGWSLVASLVVAGLWWIRDPPFAPRMETGLRAWTQEAGVRYRWTTGRASIFIPSAWQALEIPLRAEAFTPDWLPVVVEVRIDGRPVDRVTLADERWVSRVIRVDGLRTSRAFRRVDLRVNRVWSDGLYGVRLGDVRPGASQ
jgi:hypothetical protein